MTDVSIKIQRVHDDKVQIQLNGEDDQLIQMLAKALVEHEETRNIVIKALAAINKEQNEIIPQKENPHEQYQDIMDGKKVQAGHGRPLEAGIQFTKCDITGKMAWCVCVDTSDGEYGPGTVSINHIIEHLGKIINHK